MYVVIIGYQQDNMAYQYNYGNTMQPEATGHVQYRFGPPAPPPSDPPVFNNIVQAPPTAGYYPPTDPGLVSLSTNYNYDFVCNN